jgi:hypothetical protein
MDNWLEVLTAFLALACAAISVVGAIVDEKNRQKRVREQERKRFRGMYPPTGFSDSQQKMGFVDQRLWNLAKVVLTSKYYFSLNDFFVRISKNGSITPINRNELISIDPANPSIICITNDINELVNVVAYLNRHGFVNKNPVYIPPVDGAIFEKYSDIIVNQKLLENNYIEQFAQCKGIILSMAKETHIKDVFGTRFEDLGSLLWGVSGDSLIYNIWIISVSPNIDIGVMTTGCVLTTFIPSFVVQTTMNPYYLSLFMNC